MNLLVITIVAVCSYMPFSLAVKVQMPDAEGIKKRLHVVEYSADVIDHTTLMVDLVDQEEEATEIAALVEKYCIAYALHIEEKQLSSRLAAARAYSGHWKLGAQIMIALLQHAPEALQELKQQGRI